MSKMPRKYTWKHILIVVILFAIAGSVNLIPRHSMVSAPCSPGSGAKQTVKITSRGWPLTFAKKYEAKSICLTFKGGKYVQPEGAQPRQELNVASLVLNETLIVLAIGAALFLVGTRKAKK